MTASIYQSNADMAPDSAFEPGELRHLVLGNAGRLLDARRTPITIVEISLEAGVFVVRIDDFEDRGALWRTAFEDLGDYQFRCGSSQASGGDLQDYERAVARFDHQLVIECDSNAADVTKQRLARERAAAFTWLAAHSTFLAGGAQLPPPESRTGIPELYADLQAYMQERVIWDLETAFAQQFVSNPGSGDLVKGHRIVFAELGLVPYAGKITRDPQVFADAWSRDRRAEHIVARLAFVSALFQQLGRPRLVVYRGLSTDEPLIDAPNKSFVSATTCLAVARSHFESGDPENTRVLVGQAVPVERIFMSFYETACMNQQFQEAEVVLLFDSANRMF